MSKQVTAAEVERIRNANPIMIKESWVDGECWSTEYEKVRGRLLPYIDQQRKEIERLRSLLRDGERLVTDLAANLEMEGVDTEPQVGIFLSALKEHSDA